MANKKAHKNTIEITSDYKYGSAVPSGISIKTHATTLDCILGMVRLFEVTYEKAKEDGKSITEFLANCAEAYATATDSDDDDEDED